MKWFALGFTEVVEGLPSLVWSMFDTSTKLVAKTADEKLLLKRLMLLDIPDPGSDPRVPKVVNQKKGTIKKGHVHVLESMYSVSASLHTQVCFTSSFASSKSIPTAKMLWSGPCKC